MHSLKIKAICVLGGVLAILCVQVATAQAPPLGQGGLVTPSQVLSLPVTRFISPAVLLDSYTLPRWPADGSEAAARDLADVLHAQATRTADDIAQAQLDATRSPVAWAQDPAGLGSGFTPARYPLTTALLMAVHNDMRLVNRATNAQHGSRVRPSFVDARIMPVVPVGEINNPSYPSARAASTQVFARLLGVLFAHRSRALLVHAQRSAQLRLLGGVHYPTDLAAGTQVGDAYYRLVILDAQFKREFEATKAEVHAAPLP
jgi:acid phosphatase (class A)